MRWWYFILPALLVAGCAPIRPVPNPAILNWCNFPARDMEWWRDIAHEATHKPVVLFAAHGGNVAGRWYCYPTGGSPTPVSSVARMLHETYGPNVAVVLIVCNPGHLKLDVPGVWYAMDDVFIEPGNDERTSWFWGKTTGVGSFKGFVEGKACPTTQKSN